MWTSLKMEMDSNFKKKMSRGWHGGHFVSPNATNPTLIMYFLREEYWFLCRFLAYLFYFLLIIVMVLKTHMLWYWEGLFDEN